MIKISKEIYFVIINMIIIIVLSILTINRESKVENKFKSNLENICKEEGQRNLQIIYDKNLINKIYNYSEMEIIKETIKNCKKI